MLDDVSVEVLDIRSLKPLDEDALLASAAKTGRVVIVQEAPRTCGFAAELAAILAEKAILDLRGPVLRVTGYDVPYPYWQIEDAYMPSACSASSPPSGACSSSRQGRRQTGSAESAPVVADSSLGILVHDRRARTCPPRTSHAFGAKAVAASDETTGRRRTCRGQSPSCSVATRVLGTCRGRRRMSGSGSGSSGPGLGFGCATRPRTSSSLEKIHAFA